MTDDHFGGLKPTLLNQKAHRGTALTLNLNIAKKLSCI
jgi:hypothetical protein